MANTQTAVPLFVANQVLTAAQQNLSAGTGVPVFATTVTRDAAFGGSNKALAEGQLCYLEDSNIVQYYTGAAWATVGPATASGLTLVKAQTIGTGVTSVEVTSAFNATYENYLIILSGGVSSGNPNLEMKLGATTSGYAYGNIYVEYTSTTVNGEASNSASNWTRVGRGSTNSLDGEIILKFPFETKRTTGNWRTSSAASGQLWSVGGGYVDNATSYTAFTLTASGGATMTGGTVRVYGYANS